MSRPLKPVPESRSMQPFGCASLKSTSRHCADISSAWKLLQAEGTCSKWLKKDCAYPETALTGMARLRLFARQLFQQSVEVGDIGVFNDHAASAVFVVDMDLEAERALKLLFDFLHVGIDCRTSGLGSFFAFSGKRIPCTRLSVWRTESERLATRCAAFSKSSDATSSR